MFLFSMSVLLQQDNSSYNKKLCVRVCVRSDEILMVGVFSWLELGVSVIHKRQ